MFLEEFIMLNDGTIIDTARQLEEYLNSLGLDKEALWGILFKEEANRIKSLEDAYREQELSADHWYNAITSAQNEIEDMADKLASGRGGTKKDYALRFKAIMDYHCQ